VNRAFVRLACFLPAILLAGLVFGEEDPREVERQFRFLLARGEELQTQDGDADPGAPQSARLETLRRRLEADYRHFLSDHPEHTRAMVAFGSLLYDQGRKEDGIRWWEKAIALDPSEAYAYNSIANHYGHSGRAADALKLYDKAIALAPAEPVFRFNWATTCVTFRNEAHAVYGWTKEEIFRHSLDQFRHARDLAPGDFELASAYALTFHEMPKPDWAEACRAWKFCLDQPLTDMQRQFVYANLARTNIELRQFDDARQWTAKLADGEHNAVRRGLEKRIAERSKTVNSSGGTNSLATGTNAVSGKR
jgi:tetratricopeptide (TPR) repeat protein